MNSSRTLACLTSIMLIIPGISLANPGDYDNEGHGKGKKAREAAVNEQFDALDQRLLAIEFGLRSYVAINCNDDANALQNATLSDNTTYTLSGMCNGPVWIDNHRDLTLQGDTTGSKDDGVMLPPGLLVNPVGAVRITRSSAIKLENLRLSALNYVGQPYLFDAAVAGLSAGARSFVEATEVDVIGGDFAVDISNGSQLALHQGVTVTDYNRAGLSAYNHALIITHAPVTVSGIVGTSTETYPYAISAIGNSIVEINDGGSFSGASGKPVDEYPTAVWSGDNSTIHFGDGSHPTTVNGSIESAYSSMVRISGNLTLNGAMAAYHRGYIRATGTAQSGGPIYAGDAATIRFESSNLTPPNADFPYATIDVYRQGNFRMNDTMVDLGGNTLYVSGFGIINLRGASNLGGADISCHDPNQISIRNEVTGVGPISCMAPPPPFPPIVQ